MSEGALNNASNRRTPQWLCVCGNTPCDGLDCGVYLPGQAPRKPAKSKSERELSEIRRRAWATRREKYGQRGHS